jgi:hypothetical protein
MYLDNKVFKTVIQYIPLISTDLTIKNAQIFNRLTCTEMN